MFYRPLAIACLAAAGIAIAGAAGARDLTVVSWGGAYQDAQREVYFKPYVAKSGVKLKDESWDGGIGVLRAKVKGGNADWDVVQVESDELVLGCEEGLFEKLDWTALGGKQAYLPAAVHDCGVGAIVYNFILAYDGDKIKDAPKGWADFWNLAKYPGKRALRKGAKTNLEIALMADGVSPKEAYAMLKTEAGIERAFKKLDQIKAQTIWWEAGAQPPQLLASGEVAMTSAYNGRIHAANAKDKKNFKIVWDQSLYTIDSWVMLKGTPNKNQAVDLLKFVSAADNQKRLPSYIAYGVTNNAATAGIDPKVLPDLPTAPQNIANAIELDAAYWIENNDKLNDRFNKWAAR